MKHYLILPKRSLLCDNPKKNRGFTLLELLIAITLTSVIVVILSMGLRTGLRAWEKGKEQNAGLVVRTAFEGMLGRQLRALPANSPQSGISMNLFAGDRFFLSFVTTYVSQGYMTGGFLQVIYSYDPDEKRFYYCQRLVTRQEQLQETMTESIGDSDMDELEELGWEINELDGIPPVQFAYLEGQANNASAGDNRLAVTPDEWPDIWEQNTAPRAVAILWLDEDNDDTVQAMSIFYTNPFDYGDTGHKGIDRGSKN